MVTHAVATDLSPMLIPLLLLALQSPQAAPQDTLPALRPDAAALATAYANDATRELVRRARARHETIDAAVFRYQTTVRQRLSVGLRAFRRDRILYRRETAAHIDWRRDGRTRVEVVGGREAVPVALPGVRVPDDLQSEAMSLVPEPGGNRLMVGIDGDAFAWHPLIEGGEAVYTYAIGDSTRIQLPDGGVIRLVELRVTPRTRDIRYVTGSFWIDRESLGIVQAVYRPSREFDLERDLPTIDPAEAEDTDEIPDFLKPIRFEMRFMTVEYGLWEMRWWMPRLVMVDGSVQMGSVHLPVTFETTFSDYTVEADRHGLPELPPVIRSLAGDPSARARPFQYGFDVTVADSAALIDSPLLPPSLYDDASLMSDAELRELARRIGDLPPVPWELAPPRASWPWQFGRGLLRYNRVEGLSAAARVDMDLGRGALDLTGRIGTADLEPRGELGFEVPTLRRTWRLAAYHRLAVADQAVRPLALGNSMNALVLGRDDGSYFRATGAELVIRPVAGEGRHDLRAYAERQGAVERNTDFSLRHLASPDWRFRPNIRAEEATQIGVAAAVEAVRGSDPTGFRGSLRVETLAETGDFTFVRPGLTARLGFPLPGPWLGAVEAGGGTTFGTGAAGGRGAPIQSAWYLGGPATVRGFSGARLIGPDYARARLEAGNEFPGARLALFADAGWAGDADLFTRSDALLSAGVGASFLDGLFRLDLARTLQPETHWRLILHVDALF